MNSVSVVTATYRSAATLQHCIDSAARQSVGVDHILVDGAMDEDTTRLLDMREGHFWATLREPDQGIYDALNKGIRLASGDIVGILHADDWLADSEVIRCVVEAMSDTDVQAVYGSLEYVDPENPNRVVRRWEPGPYVQNSWVHGWMPPHPTFFVRRECYEKYGLYRLDLGTAADYELMLRFLLVHKIRVKYIPRVMVKMRAGGTSNASLGARIRANRMDRKAWEVNNLKPRPWTLLAKPLRKLPQWWLR